MNIHFFGRSPTVVSLPLFGLLDAAVDADVNFYVLAYIMASLFNVIADAIDGFYEWYINC